MTTSQCERRTDTASRIIRASPNAIYAAMIDPNAIVQWRPPSGMTASMQHFEPRVGGTYYMVLTYETADQQGKISRHSDEVRGQFVERVQNERMMELVRFQSDDPDLQGAMTITTTLTEVSHETEVKVTCENVPHGIAQRDHEAGMASSLTNLAALVE
jgi:uncharacterized protein YndB with AHSA1/START domain